MRCDTLLCVVVSAPASATLPAGRSVCTARGPLNCRLLLRLPFVASG